MLLMNLEPEIGYPIHKAPELDILSPVSGGVSGPPVLGVTG